jgi:sugar-specific transcriptional regulator TrmB
MEKVGKMPMETLHKNAERIWKLLNKYPNGTTARELRKITGMSETAVYDALKELQTKGFIENKRPLWIIKIEASNTVLRELLEKSFVSERLLRRHLEKNSEIKALLAKYERKFGKIENIREEILDDGSDVVKMGFADNLSKEDVKRSIERERLRRLIAENVEKTIYP